MNIGRSEYARLKKAAGDLEVLKDAVRYGLASWQCGCVAENSEMFKRLSRLVEEKEQGPEDEGACPEHYEEVPAHE